LLGCGVSNLSNVIDAPKNNFATLSVALGVAASVSLRVTDSAATYPPGRKVGFLVADTNALLSVQLLGNITVVTLLNGNVQEIASGGSLLHLEALGLLYDPGAAFVEFTATKPFNSAQLIVGSLASVLSSFKVYGACATLQ
jgi:trimeric autotransporter adhesin